MTTANFRFKRLLSSLLLVASFHAHADNPSNLQDHAALRQIAIDFLTQQAAGQTGEINISVGQIDNRLNLAACVAPQPFLPTGSKPWGKTTMGIRCSAPVSWVIYLQANVKISAEYYVAARPLSQGQVLSLSDLNKIQGELSSLPAGVITNPEQAIGKTMQVSVPSGSVLRMDSLKSAPVIQQGQSVRVVSSGVGFQVATDGQALSNASDGQIARAKTNSGQTVSGIARAGGIIEINY